MLANFGAATERLKEVASKSRVVDEQNSRLLLPSDRYTRPWVPGLDELPAPGAYFCPTIVGCVTYQLTSDRSLHQTAFCFVLDPVSGDGSPHAFISGESIDPEHIKVLWWAGGFAD
jgi:hypothetical protein